MNKRPDTDASLIGSTYNKEKRETRRSILQEHISLFDLVDQTLELLELSVVATSLLHLADHPVKSNPSDAVDGVVLGIVKSSFDVLDKFF